MTALFTIQSSFIDCCLLSSFLKPHDCSFSYKDSRLKDTQLTFEDMKHIRSELNNLEESYKAAFESTNNYKQHLNSELQDPTRMKWELEHQTKRNHNYKASFVKIAQDIAELKDRLSKIGTRRWSFPSTHAFSFVCDGSSRSLVVVFCHHRTGVPSLSAGLDLVRLNVLLLPLWNLYGV